jgi:hypothetical protein
MKSQPSCREYRYAPVLSDAFVHRHLAQCAVDVWDLVTQAVKWHEKVFAYLSVGGDDDVATIL